ncbi:MAG: glycerate kinase [Daejeonella sp.]|uniref:glycerate kinase n=1 Tax=Daejeonella sp. JGW-45 TaxID=3034148 RepID=UPI0023EB41EA|nr:glycerate kinase [Daejeonella sp. JGW-45]
MHILIAPNAFKNSLDARAVAEAISRGLMSSTLICTTECFPIGDGGDGTAAIIIERFNGTRVGLEVKDSLGRQIESSFGLINGGKTAVIEMADASGLRLLGEDELDPLKTSSFGTGQMIIAALDKGVTEIILGLGGSATVDGGAGLLNALGVRFLDKDGRALMPDPQSLAVLDKIDLASLDERILGCKITVLCDVDNPLLGADGAAAVFGPQKGAKYEDLPKLEGVLFKLNELIFKQNGKRMDVLKHGGAAGGTAAGLHAFIDADLVEGAEHLLKITGFDERLDKCDLLITGEGSLDEQTLQGKAPYAVALRAKKRNIPVIGVGGNLPLRRHGELEKYFDALVPIGHRPSNLVTAISNTEANLVRTGIMIGNLLSVKR